MPIYQASIFESETVIIVKADSKKDVMRVLEENQYEEGEYDVDGKTIFASSRSRNANALKRIIKIGE